MPPRRPKYSFSTDTYRPGKARISEIINLKNTDFGSNRNNRYMKINEGKSKTSVRSTNQNSRHLAAFKNPLLNSYDDDGDEDYEPKHFEFDFDDDNDVTITQKLRKKSKNRQSSRTRRSNADSQQKESFEEIRRRREREKKEIEIIENARRLKEFEENERMEKIKRKERNARRDRLKKEKENRIKNRNGNTKSTGPKKTKQVDEKKVGETVKLIEQILQESKKQTKSPDTDEEHYYDVVDINKTKSRSQRDGSVTNSTVPNSRDGGKSSADVTKSKAEVVQSKDGRRRKQSSANQSAALGVVAVGKKKRSRTKSKTRPSDVTEQEKAKYFNEKRIVVNQAVDDNIDTKTLAKKPVKKNLGKEKSFVGKDKTKAGKSQDNQSTTKATVFSNLNKENSHDQSDPNSIKAEKAKKVIAKNNIDQISDMTSESKSTKENMNPRNDGTNTKKDQSLPNTNSHTAAKTLYLVTPHQNRNKSQNRNYTPLSNRSETPMELTINDKRQTNLSNLSHHSGNSRINGNDMNTFQNEISKELSKDHLQYAPTAKIYVSTLIDDVQNIVSDVEREKDLYEKRGRSANISEEQRRINRHLDQQKKLNGKNYEREKSRELVNFKEKDIAKYKPSKKEDSNNPNNTNSLGLTMEGKNGIYMAIIKGTTPEFIEVNDHIIHKNSLRGEKDEQILLRKNYQNLEELINHTMGYDDYDSHYLKIAKLNRLKVIMETSMKIVGRPFNDVGNEERNNLELEANRFHTTYPLPGEEVLLEEIDGDGERHVRMPLKIVQDEGMAKIDINDNYQIDPSEFLTLYTNKLVNYAEDTTSLKFNNITLAIPATYGAAQREALKNSVNDATDRDDVQILTRPVAATVILNNQRNNDQMAINSNSNTASLSSYSSQAQEVFKLVFDMTEGSMDASVIRIKDSKDFHVISNVGDTSFGLHDLDERIVEYIINEKSKRRKRFSRTNNLESESDHDLETVNAYANLIKNIKLNIEEVGAVNVDLVNMNEATETLTRKKRREDELYIDKSLIMEKLCKDIYDWALAHIEKSIIQADLNDRDIDEIVIIGGPHKMPGFREYIKHAYPYKRVSFVQEEELAVGASIVGRKLKYQQIKVTEVLCRSIGIGLYTGVITYLLFRNSSLPCIGGCVYSTLVDDQESMVLDIYEGERPHVKFCRYLGEVTVFDLPKGPAGSVKCEIYLKMDHEGLLEVTARDLESGAVLETAIDANPEHLLSDDVNNDTELDPIEAERYKKFDYDLVYQLEKLDEHLDDLNEKYMDHQYAKYILEKIFDTKEWLYNNRRNVTVDECHGIRIAIEKFLTNIENLA